MYIYCTCTTLFIVLLYPTYCVSKLYKFKISLYIPDFGICIILCTEELKKFIHIVPSGYYGFSVFLIDHAWTYRTDQARDQLESVAGLLDRMAGIMDLEREGKDRAEVVEEVLEEMWR